MSRNYPHHIVSIKEKRSGKSVPEQTGETSRGNEQMSIAIEEDRSRIIKEKMKSFDDTSQDIVRAEEKLTIPKVSHLLRENQRLKKYFMPRVVSIGPYHHGNSNLEVTEKLKFEFAKIFFKVYGVVNKEDLHLKIKERIDHLRSCYEEEATKRYADDDLAWMFLIDGSVVLHFICFYADYKSARSLNALEILESKLFRFAMDLFLLENQLPYEVLHLIISSSNDSQALEQLVKQFIFDTGHIVGKEENLKLPPSENIHHLLDLLWSSIIQVDESNEKSSSIVLVCLLSILGFVQYIKKLMHPLVAIVLYILEMPLNFLVSPRPVHNVISLHSVDELKKAGIKLRPSDTDYLTDISFSRGTLKLPPVSLCKSTVIKLLNLAAYEDSYGMVDVNHVSQFISYLATIIRQAEDVKELQVSKVVYNYLDRDEEVVDFFKEIRSDMKTSFGTPYYDIFNRIQVHCDKKYNVWMAQLRNRYFESPWSVIALLGAVIALGVTIFQTAYPMVSKPKL